MAFTIRKAVEDCKEQGGVGGNNDSIWYVRWGGKEEGLRNQKPGQWSEPKNLICPLRRYQANFSKVISFLSPGST